MRLIALDVQGQREFVCNKSNAKSTKEKERIKILSRVRQLQGSALHPAGHGCLGNPVSSCNKVADFSNRV